MGRMDYFGEDDSGIIETAGLEHFYRNVEPLDSINNNNYKMSLIKKVFQWFVYSSANPQLISLTVKGLLPFLLLLGIDLTATDEFSNAVTDVIVSLGLTLSAFLTLGGFLRKIYYSLK